MRRTKSGQHIAWPFNEKADYSHHHCFAFIDHKLTADATMASVITRANVYLIAKIVDWRFIVPMAVNCMNNLDDGVRWSAECGGTKLG